MKTFIGSGIVEKGQLKIRNRKRFEDEFKGWRDCNVTITIERSHATRSHAQNAWYFGVILKMISDETGYTQQELHEFFKTKFNAKTIAIVDQKTGEVTSEQVIGQTTTTLNKLQFGEFCESVRHWAAEQLGLDIPDPKGIAA